MGEPKSFNQHWEEFEQHWEECMVLHTATAEELKPAELRAVSEICFYAGATALWNCLDDIGRGIEDATRGMSSDEVICELERRTQACQKVREEVRAHVHRQLLRALGR